MAQIDVPLLNSVEIVFFNQLLFHTPQILQFLSRAETLNTINQATVVFLNNMVVIKLPQKTETANNLTGLSVAIAMHTVRLAAFVPRANLRLVFAPSFHLGTRRLRVIYEGRHRPPAWQDDMKDSQWLEPLQPYIAVKDLYLPKQVALRVAPFLQEISGETTLEVLPALQNLFLEESQVSEPIQEATGKLRDSSTAAM